MFLGFAETLEGDLDIDGCDVEPLRQACRRGDDQARPVPFDQALARESPKNERHGFTCRSHELTQQAVARGAQHDTAVIFRKRAAGRHANERSHQALFHAEGGQFAESIEQHGAFRHHLLKERQRMLWLLANERAELRGAEEEGFALLVGAGVRGIAGSDSQTFRAERLSRHGDPRNEPATCADAAAEDDATSSNDEYAVGRGAALINCESRGPSGTSCIRRQRVSFCVSESSESRRYRFSHTTLASRDSALGLQCPGRS